MGIQDNFEQIPLKDFTEKAYLDYSMYVILFYTVDIGSNNDKKVNTYELELHWY
jgi:hypothetical protein